MNRLAGKVAVVIGGGGGIGRAITLRFAAEGATVIATGTGSSAKKVAAEAPGGRVTAERCDVANPGDVDALFAACRAARGRLDVLCNAAGISIGRSALHEVSIEAWDRLMTVNLRGCFAVMKAAIPLMIDSGGGSIINIGSTGSLRATAGVGPYVASKGGMLMLTRAAALDYAAKKIRVNALCPGTTETAMTAKQPPEVLKMLVDRIPMGRLAKVDEIAAFAAFLASDEAAYLTGQAYVIDGGRFAGG